MTFGIPNLPSSNPKASMKIISGELTTILLKSSTALSWIDTTLVTLVVKSPVGIMRVRVTSLSFIDALVRAFAPLDIAICDSQPRSLFPSGPSSSYKAGKKALTMVSFLGPMVTAVGNNVLGALVDVGEEVGLKVTVGAELLRLGDLVGPTDVGV
eukprot:CAMPEP_0197518388 /NCGR_PEP_ID=MMETSP1318-20131121/3576_1 /TAXON_ID=552666 /ORGANISM="Partenskyella glossopodia, Strain RCC365" /LENGTH=154 /DNA_ID=CAMNT_0043068699 /DNA_START=330 /DNA_END=794 /DNA_ORIENTATION=+